MSISIRLKAVLDDKQLKIKDFSEKCGIPYRSIQNYLREERAINADVLKSIHVHLGININWLLTGEGEMYAGSPTQEVWLNKKTGKPILISELSDSIEMLIIKLDRAREEAQHAKSLVDS